MSLSEPDACELCGGTGHSDIRCPHEWLSYSFNEINYQKEETDGE